jgi:uncharacterized protein (DUF2267 family)
VNYDNFVGSVHHLAKMSSKGDAVAAIRATLTTLGERLTKEEGRDLAAQLPKEIALYLHEGQKRALIKRSLPEFFEVVAEREGVDVDAAEQHARSVCSVLCAAVSPGEISDVTSQLPTEFRTLFPRPSP